MREWKGSLKSIPETVNTVHGEMDIALLNKRTGEIDNENETTTWVEYYFNGELVHRSAHVTLKKMPPMSGVIQPI